MNEILKNLYESALEHRNAHLCGAVPYQNGEFLMDFSSSIKPKRILEIGTGVGYSTVCLALGNKRAFIDTIDKDADHISLARENCEKLGLKNVIFHESKAEDMFPQLSGPYDLIFYDGFTPQKKFVAQFERLLRKGGVALSTNLFLSDPSGGGYLKLLQTEKWNTKVEGDTAISILTNHL